MSARVTGLVEMAIAMAVSGTIGWFVIMSGLAVPEVVFWRCLLGAMLLYPICWRMGAFRTRVPMRSLATAAAGGVALIANWIFLFMAYSRASISIATAVYNLQPFILVTLGSIFLGERLTIAKFGWLALGFTGLLLIVQVSGGEVASTYFLGILLALAAALFWALAAIASKMATGMSPQLIAVVHVSLGGLFLAPFAALGDVPTGMTSWSILLTLGFVHTGLVYILMYDAIQKLPTHLQGALAFLNPVAAFVVDVLAFGHKFELTQILGMAIIVIAAAGMNGLAPLRHPGRKARLEPDTGPADSGIADNR